MQLSSAHSHRHPALVTGSGDKSKVINPLQKITLMDPLVKPEESKIAAFTLVEMSIVLIIIGLIVAGISKGQGMIAAAKINAQVQQLTYFEVAYNTFQLKYDAVPGDMNNASDYWPGTANGDGNGRLTEDANFAYDTSRENLKFFTHLSKAKLLKYDYDGTWELDKGYPSLEIKDRTGMIAGGALNDGADSPTLTQVSNAIAGAQKRAALYLNVSRPWRTNWQYNRFIGTMSPVQTQAIDKKIDDGIARTGRFRGYRGRYSVDGNCLDGIDGDYLLSEPDLNCMGEYILEK